MSLDLRPARIEDAAAIAELHVRSSRLAYAALVDETVLSAFTLEGETARWAKRLGQADAGRSCDVVLRDGYVCGFVSYGPARGIAGATEIHSLHVAAAQHGQGLGFRLMRHALARSVEVGASVVLLWVVEQNARARRFYERQGFCLDGNRKTTRYGDYDVAELCYRIDRSKAGPPA